MRERWLKIISILIAIVLIILIVTALLKHNDKKYLNENTTTTLKSDADFLDWFIDFDNLYQKKVKSPKYSLKKEHLKLIKDLLNNKPVENITFYNNTYKINDNIDIELDVNTRSLRYTKYNKKDIMEILEIKIKNGKYYVQLANDNKLSKIVFSRKYYKKETNKIEKVKIKNSIYGTEDFKW